MHRLSAYVIVHRTQSDQTADRIRLDGGQNPIGWRTESDRTANGIRSDGGQNPNGRRTQRIGGAAVSAAPTKPTGNLLQLSPLHQPSKQAIYCSCLRCTNQANWQSIAAVSTAPTKQTGNLLQLSQLGFAACQSKNCINKANRAIHQGVQLSQLHQQSKQSKNCTNKAYRYHFTNRSLIHAQRGIMRHAATSSR